MIEEDYKALLDQLAKMKSVCDKLKQNNLRRDLDQLQSSLAKYENNTRGERVSVSVSVSVLSPSCQ